MGQARIVSDGSFDPESKRGTAALFMTSSESKLNLLKAATLTFGHKEDQSAYRSELTGVVLGLSIIATMVEYFDLTKGEVEFAFDNKSSEHKVENLTEDIHITNKYFDLLQDIKHCLERLPIQVRSRWVKGHIRETGATMDWWEYFNDQANKLAKEWRVKCVENNREFSSP